MREKNRPCEDCTIGSVVFIMLQLVEGVVKVSSHRDYHHKVNKRKT